jgi:hypothetical protein
VEFIETHIFTKLILELLTDDEYRSVQLNLAKRPDQGQIITESGGLRKTRIAAKGKGKSGGARIIYYWVPTSARIYMLLAYPKNQKDDLNAEEVAFLRDLMKRELGHG